MPNNTVNTAVNTAITGAWNTDALYQAERDSMLVFNENYSSQIYLDHRGIPTVGVGVSLLTLDKVSGKFIENTDNTKYLKDNPNFSAIHMVDPSVKTIVVPEFETVV